MQLKNPFELLSVSGIPPCTTAAEIEDAIVQFQKLKPAILLFTHPLVKANNSIYQWLLEQTSARYDISPVIKASQNYPSISKANGGIRVDLEDWFKDLYEKFYRKHYKLKSDTLGTVYTPREIIQFQVESINTMLQQQYQKRLSDPVVRIIDPVSGLGVYITEAIRVIYSQAPEALKYKYQRKMYANEIELFPCFLTQLNVESIYAELTGEYLSFTGVKRIDTLSDEYGKVTWKDEYYLRNAS